LDLLRKSAPSRIVNVASMVHKNARFDPADPEMKDGWDGYTAYANSKLANILFTAELSRRLAGTGVSANSANPGLVNSEFFRNYKRMPFMLRVVKKMVGKTTAQGARTAVMLASSPEVEGVTGRYFSDGKIAETSPRARDADLAGKLWDLSAVYIGWKNA
jgi:NAD(P)-dependent dehydrogenase (short-subunit alcohol dehydrogenase family)